MFSTLRYRYVKVSSYSKTAQAKYLSAKAFLKTAPRRNGFQREKGVIFRCVAKSRSQVLTSIRPVKLLSRHHFSHSYSVLPEISKIENYAYNNLRQPERERERRTRSRSRSRQNRQILPLPVITFSEDTTERVVIV